MSHITIGFLGIGGVVRFLNGFGGASGIKTFSVRTFGGGFHVSNDFPIGRALGQRFGGLCVDNGFVNGASVTSASIIGGASGGSRTDDGRYITEPFDGHASIGNISRIGSSIVRIRSALSHIGGAIVRIRSTLSRIVSVIVRIRSTLSRIVSVIVRIRSALSRIGDAIVRRVAARRKQRNATGTCASRVRAFLAGARPASATPRRPGRPGHRKAGVIPIFGVILEFLSHL